MQDVSLHVSQFCTVVRPRLKMRSNNADWLNKLARLLAKRS
jgi:hypothetical protein